MKAWCALVVLVAACKFPELAAIPDGSDMPPPPATRLIAPLSGSIVTQQRPTLRWSLAPGDTVSSVDLCVDRACTSPRSATVQMASDGLSGVPSAPLPAGWTYWRVRANSGSGQVTTATWQLWVGKHGASSPADSASGTILDVNGDGFADFVAIAHPCSDPAGSGAAHVYLGSATAGAATWNGSAPPGRIDLTPPRAGEAYGAEAVAIGDVNGDGYGDFAVLGELYQPGGADVRNHIYLGGPSPSANDWNGSGSARIDVPSNVNLSSIAALGDFNADGYADFALGEFPYAKVYLGSPAPSAAGWVSDNVLTIGSSGNAVYAVAGADVNGDGYGDLVATGLQTHLVFFGGPMVSLGEVPLGFTNLDSANGATPSAAAIGDVNGDGFADVVIESNPSTSGGAAHVYFGSASPSAAAWNAASTPQRLDLSSSSGVFGISVGGGGDVDGDGYGDFVLGLPSYQGGSDGASVYRGAASATAIQTLGLASPDGSGARYGASTAGLGDVNGDGYTDFGVGTFTSGSTSSIHVYLGSASPASTTWDGSPSPQRIDVASPEAGACFGFRTN
ncbi:MAG: FG-GAP repeat domain-containing protein [Acidobacteriota bacterium]